MIQLSLLLTGLIQGLRRVIARAAPVVSAPARPIWAGPEQRWIIAPHGDLPILPGPIWTLLCLRLQRLNNRLTRLYDRWQTNTLPTPRPTTTRPDSVRHSRAPERIQSMPMAGAELVEAPARLPRARGWITRRIPEAGPSAGWLEHLLQQPHTQDFVQAAPQVARLLRPLCHALGVDQPDWLKLPPRPRTPRKPRPAKPRRLALTNPALKLRPYEIAAARYFIEKYGRD